MSLKNSSKPPATYEELLARQYGSGRDPADQLAGLDARIAAHYGTRWGRPRVPARAVRVRPVVRNEPAAAPDPGPFEEYVVARAPAPAVPGPQVSSARSMAETVAPNEEYVIDVLSPLGPPDTSAPRPLELLPTPGPAPVEERERPSPAPVAARPATPAGAPASPSQSQSADDEFIADMQSILTGKKVYDQASRKTVDREQAARNAGGSQPQPSPSAEPSQAQSIFDRIKKSMEFANSFDLGTVELDRRFEQFDQLADATQRGARRPAVARQASIAPPRIGGTAAFLEDLDAIQRDRERAAAQSIPDGLARPFYDAGEHVLAAGDLYVDRLRVGSPPGVLFSYGELVAMGDLYASADKMMEADVSELQRIKTLIDRSAAYYAGGKRDEALDVGDAAWEGATRERYLVLAEDNFHHFSPNTIFKVASFAAGKGDHRTQWEFYHRRALEEAQRTLADGQARKQTVFPERALIVNAFGDHFLTDAFAAGHQVNKEEVIHEFRRTFYTNAALTGAAEQFFAKVARLAWKGEVKQRFSVLETYDPVFLWWHPNIDTENAFRTLLVKVATEQPDAIANLAVKALHDDLNRNGVEVTNDAGDGVWTIAGDGFLNPTGKTLAVMRRAVTQSAGDVTDPLLGTGPLPHGKLAAQIWKNVPRPTAAGLTRLTQLGEKYTRPESDALAEAAADLLTRKISLFIKKLIERKKLRPA